MKIYLLFLLIVTLHAENTSNQGECTVDSTEQHCLKKDQAVEEDDEPVFYEEDEIAEDPSEKWKGREALFQWDPVKVGHERRIEVAPGQTVSMVTAAVKPKAFLIDNFLTEAECDHVINKALTNGLHDSSLHIDPETRKSKQYTQGHSNSAIGDFRHWDRNQDGEATIQEVKRMAEKTIKLYFNETDIKEMFEILKINTLDDGIITRDEFTTMNTAGLSQYMNDLREENPRFRDRFSEQIWLRQGDSSDRVMQGLREKVRKLTNLPEYIVNGGEALQVLRYQPFGHYHAHFDSQDKEAHPDKPMCCHMDPDASPDNCRLCRLVTILYFLSDVEEGGETAFPVADKEDYDHEEFRKREKDDLYNLSKFCHNATLVVKPKKGRALLWYNHHLDNNKWLGAMDYWSLHGGCDIIKGTKWLANNWLTAPTAELAHIDSLYLSVEAPGAF